MTKAEKPDLEKISLYIETQQAKKLREWSEHSLITITALIRRAIDESLETHKKER